MPYSYVTLATAIQQLANRLNDATMQFFPSVELQSYIVESLRTFNALSNYHKTEFVFQTAANVFWYDFTDAANLPTSLRLLTVTDQNIYNTIQSHLLEPRSTVYPLVWTGSRQFTIDDLVQAVARRRDEILSITGCTITRRLVAAVPGRTFLPDTAIDIRRVAWLPVVNPLGYTASPLLPSDTFGVSAFETGYTTAAGSTPYTYLRSSEPPLSFDVDVPPALPGNYDVLTVDAGGALSIAASSLLNIPDDWTWLIKWGALSDLLGRESVAKDSLRAKYAEARYQQGLSILAMAPALLALRLNNIPFQVDSVRDLDNFQPGWQAQVAGQPGQAGTAGMNLIALAPKPDVGPYGVTAMVVQNAPVPVLPGDFLQVGRDDYDVILDYAQHIASFKMGGAEFMATVPLYDRFVKQAALYNTKLRAMGEFTEIMLRTSRVDEVRNPRMMEIASG